MRVSVCVCIGPPSAGPLSRTPLRWIPLRRTAQNVDLFFPLPHPFSLFFSLWGSSRVIFYLYESSRGNVVVFQALRPSNVHVWALGLSCETPAAWAPNLRAPHPLGPPTFSRFGPPPLWASTPLGLHPAHTQHNTPTQHTHTTHPHSTHTTHTHKKENWPKSNLAQVELA